MPSWQLNAYFLNRKLLVSCIYRSPYIPELHPWASCSAWAKLWGGLLRGVPLQGKPTIIANSIWLDGTYLILLYNSSYSLLSQQHSSGDLEDGWMLSLMTSYRQSMGDLSLFTPKTQLSSGLLCWRKPMLSMENPVYCVSVMKGSQSEICLFGYLC